ncbi:helix-turn-helix domain-containing protein [Ekhidna sp.]|uniref:helix-turn-helix domain-containing protein n=1 Tax=Ekhidna sp. TaxID=2608089 RepID=UPI003CCBB58E
MYTQELGLKEEYAIVDEIQLLRIKDANQEIMMVPDNKAEIYIALTGKMSFKSLGSIRPLIIEKGKGYFMMPRRRGAEVNLTNGMKCLILKVNPIYSKKISESLAETSNGIFEFSISSELCSKLIESYHNADVYEASDLIRDICVSGIDWFDYNLTILESIDRIRHSCGTISVKEIYKSLNVSKSKLEQHFNREIGLTPKEFCKIEKINCFINLYYNNSDQSFTELTYQCGYYDQSHLIKDFKYFLDTSPKKYFCNYR